MGLRCTLAPERARPALRLTLVHGAVDCLPNWWSLRTCLRQSAAHNPACLALPSSLGGVAVAGTLPVCDGPESSHPHCARLISPPASLPIPLLPQALEAAPASALLVAPAVETALTPREAALLAPVVEAIAAAVPAAETTARTGGLRKLQQARWGGGEGAAELLSSTPNSK